MRRFARTLGVACLALAPAGTAIAAASEAAPAMAWDLRPLYATDAAWDAERQAIEAELPGLSALKGTLTDGATLEAGLDKIWALKKRVSRLDTYASLSADADTRVEANQVRRQRADDLRNKLDERIAFLNPEIIALGRQRIEDFLAERPGLAKDRYQLQTILREAGHTLGQEAENLLAAAQTPLEQPGSIYGLLANADIPWPGVDIRGKKVTLDQEGYVAHRDDRDPKVRGKVFATFWPVFKTYERTFGATYAANLRGTVFAAKARKYPDSMAQALARDNVPEDVYKTLIAEAHNGLPTLHRYLADGKKLLGLKEFRYSDIYVPFAAPPRHYTMAEAERLVLEALAPLGDDYVRDLDEGFRGGWMHAQPQRGKRSGAYMNGSAYDVHPYVLMSYSGKYESVSTLAHEFGHAMHSVLTNRTQPFETADYSIFVAEIPSTTNEMLLIDHVIARSRTKAEKIYALSQALELLRGTFFRQAMFAEFEALTHAAIERGDPLTGEGLSKIYLGLLRRYMGEAEGVMKIDDLYGVEWAYVPHFYNDFYVYQYATSISAAAYFAEGIEKGDQELRRRYFDMLKAGGSDDPYLIVRKAGPDLASPEPYRALVRRMDRLLDQLEAAMAEKE
ncbi:oligoendopeptidase F [Telmatospirillum siberiense]|uniref:Oligopeptidase F n=1 Tax=Telmatospirillum siberiense TaxID=382514 RepID=A0A2N3PR02_9PROT|nr:oligoendopeptidase F [Telmatospirillum siberiense]PKU22828.1 oligoendopeptidase F [Telmatospirillum siberiense]